LTLPGVARFGYAIASTSSFESPPAPCARTGVAPSQLTQRFDIGGTEAGYNESVVTSVSDFTFAAVRRYVSRRLTSSVRGLDARLMRGELVHPFSVHGWDEPTAPVSPTKLPNERRRNGVISTKSRGNH